MAKPRRSRPPAGRPPRAKVAALSHRLNDLLAEAQRRQKVPSGMAQCPLCGAIVEPMRIGKVRTHDNPLGGARCAASGRLWVEFGKRAPKPPKAAAKAVPKVARNPARRAAKAPAKATPRRGARTSRRG